ncbi:MAG: hypothetical protein RBR74_05610 [Ignavibacteriaceae bacterium]|nr:hypothetical protein [Ignavibacteriaceae bacterium]
MIRLKFINYIFFIVLLFSSTILFAQSDYEIVQSFKERNLNLTNSIKEARSLEELDSIRTEIDNFKRDFIAKKFLLDQSLYPENFLSAIDNLVESLELRRDDFTEIDVLKTEVTVLKSEVDLLNKRNNELLDRISILETQKSKDAATIDELEKLIADLRITVLKRDQLIFSIVDSLTPKLAGDVSSMTKRDKEQVYSQIERNNLLATIKKSLRDNSRFLEVTSLKVGDLDEVRKQQENFVSMWNKIGPKLIEVYAGKKEQSAELKEIDNLLTVWSNRIKKEAWESINEEFSLHNINLQEFNNGNDFSSIVLKYISDEIKNYGIKNKEESEKNFTAFADSVWFKSISLEWMPYLLNSKLLTTAQKDEIEKKISEWKSVMTPKDTLWLYAVIGLAVLFVVALFFILRKKKVDPSESAKV